MISPCWSIFSPHFLHISFTFPSPPVSCLLSLVFCSFPQIPELAGRASARGPERDGLFGLLGCLSKVTEEEGKKEGREEAFSKDSLWRVMASRLRTIYGINSHGINKSQKKGQKKRGTEETRKKNYENNKERRKGKKREKKEKNQEKGKKRETKRGRTGRTGRTGKTETATKCRKARVNALENLAPEIWERLLEHGSVEFAELVQEFEKRGRGKRRMYDVINVLAAVGLIHSTGGKNTVLTVMSHAKKESMTRDIRALELEEEELDKELARQKIRLVGLRLAGAEDLWVSPDDLSRFLVRGQTLHVVTSSPFGTAQQSIVRVEEGPRPSSNPGPSPISVSAPSPLSFLTLRSSLDPSVTMEFPPTFTHVFRVEGGRKTKVTEIVHKKEKEGKEKSKQQAPQLQKQPERQEQEQGQFLPLSQPLSQLNLVTLEPPHSSELTSPSSSPSTLLPTAPASLKSLEFLHSLELLSSVFSPLPPAQTIGTGMEESKKKGGKETRGEREEREEREERNNGGSPKSPTSPRPLPSIGEQKTCSSDKNTEDQFQDWFSSLFKDLNAPSLPEEKNLDSSVSSANRTELEPEPEAKHAAELEPPEHVSFPLNEDHRDFSPAMWCTAITNGTELEAEPEAEPDPEPEHDH